MLTDVALTPAVEEASTIIALLLTLVPVVGEITSAAIAVEDTFTAAVDGPLASEEQGWKATVEKGVDILATPVAASSVAATDAKESSTGAGLALGSFRAAGLVPIGDSDGAVMALSSSATAAEEALTTSLSKDKGLALATIGDSAVPAARAMSGPKATAPPSRDGASALVGLFIRLLVQFLDKFSWWREPQMLL